MKTKQYYMSLYYGDFEVANRQKITEKQASEYIKNLKDIAEKTKTDTDIYNGTQLITEVTETEGTINTAYHLEGTFWFDMWIIKSECKEGYHFKTKK